MGDLNAPLGQPMLRGGEDGREPSEDLWLGREMAREATVLEPCVRLTNRFKTIMLNEDQDGPLASYETWAMAKLRRKAKHAHTQLESYLAHMLLHFLTAHISNLPMWVNRCFWMACEAFALSLALRWWIAVYNHMLSLSPIAGYVSIDPFMDDSIKDLFPQILLPVTIAQICLVNCIILCNLHMEKHKP